MDIEDPGTITGSPNRRGYAFPSDLRNPRLIADQLSSRSSCSSLLESRATASVPPVTIDARSGWRATPETAALRYFLSLSMAPSTTREPLANAATLVGESVIQSTGYASLRRITRIAATNATMA